MCEQNVDREGARVCEYEVGRLAGSLGGRKSGRVCYFEVCTYLHT